LVVVTLVGGIAATAWQAGAARIERARAERRFNDVRKLANSFLFELHDAIQNLPGSTPARELLVRKALEYLESLAREAGSDAALRVELAEAYRRVGDVQGNPYNPNLGDTAGAQDSFRKSAWILEELLAANPSHTAAREALASNYQRIADSLSLTGDLKGADETNRKSTAMYEALARESNTPLARHRLAISYIKAGDLAGNPSYPNLGNRAASLDYYRRSQGLIEALHAAKPTDPAYRRFRSVITERIGVILEADGKLEEARENYARALGITEALHAETPNNSGTRRDLAAGHARMGKILTLQGDTRKCAESYGKSLAILEGLHAADPSNANASQSLAEVYGMAAACSVKGGDPGEAGKLYAKALVLLEGVAATDPKNQRLQEGIRETRSHLAAFKKK